MGELFRGESTALVPTTVMNLGGDALHDDGLEGFEVRSQSGDCIRTLLKARVWHLQLQPFLSAKVMAWKWLENKGRSGSFPPGSVIASNRARGENRSDCRSDQFFLSLTEVLTHFGGRGVTTKDSTFFVTLCSFLDGLSHPRGRPMPEANLGQVRFFSCRTRR